MPAKIGNRIKTTAALSGPPESMKQTNKLEAVPAHRERRTDKSLRTLAQMRTACILHSQFGMTRFIGLHRPTSFPPSFSVCPPSYSYIYIYIHFRVVLNKLQKKKKKKKKLESTTSYIQAKKEIRDDDFSINFPQDYREITHFPRLGTQKLINFVKSSNTYTSSL